MKWLRKLLPFINAGTASTPLLLLATYAADNESRQVCFTYMQIFVVGLIIYALLEMNRRTPTRRDDDGRFPPE